eukprot:Gregarina_sp_Poly_1__6225@NODE_32_length_19284_cov_132_623615_g29_i0_p17_GENE_NODE_32_length_19284_cov_132_623615_g29_i0NODE_32_length_19284_cov_132_623615_g29_i0_p17_ORF_typecomplete_len100_score8_27_NODE_32_length_19284_cov_132_623615_g29_i079368235
MMVLPFVATRTSVGNYTRDYTRGYAWIYISTFSSRIIDRRQTMACSIVRTGYAPLRPVFAEFHTAGDMPPSAASGVQFGITLRARRQGTSNGFFCYNFP